MNTLTRQQFLDKIGTKRKEIFITSFTDVKTSKDCPYKNIKKIQDIRVAVNFNYVHEVNKQRLNEEKDMDFIPSSRKWGTRVDNTCLIEHKGQYYIECEYLEKKNEYYIDDNRKLLTKGEIEQYLPVQKGSSSQKLDNPVRINTFKIENIKEIEIDGEKFLFFK